MSKSGSRYGRRSNWFKIHCLLQEQQNKVNNNTTSNNNNNIENSSSHNSNNNSSSSPSVPLPNDFISSHFLANLYSSYSSNNNNNSKAQEVIKRVSSPSDSGASSADLDETSIKFRNNNNVAKSKNLNSVENVKREKTKSPSSDGYISPVINSRNLKPTPFLPFSIHHHLPTAPRTPTAQELFMLSLPQISLTPSPRQQKVHNSFTDTEQNEPIDLSLKSTAIKRLRDSQDEEDCVNRKQIRPSTPEVHHEAAAAATRTVPLDLTLVRSG